MTKNRNERAGLYVLREIATRARYLSAEQEHELAKQAKRGSRLALDRLLRAHLRLVLRIASTAAKGDCSYDELVSEGLLGMTVAAQHFDPERGVRFSTYAVPWIRTYVQRYRLSNRRIVRMPATRASRVVLAHISRLERQWLQEHGSLPSSEAVARVLRLDEGDVQEITQALRGSDVPASHDGFELRSETPTPEAFASDEERKRLDRGRVRRALAQLPARERRIMERRHLSERPCTLAELGRDLGISRERVRQLELLGRMKLRDLLGEVEPDEAMDRVA